MGILENFVSNAKQAANVVGKKTGELVDTSKLKLQAAEINGDIRRSFEALGRALYEARKQDIQTTEEIDDIILLINHRYDELDEVNEQLTKLSSKTACPRCGEMNVKSANFCSRCGEKLLVEQAPTSCGCGCSCGAEEPAETEAQEDTQE